MQAGEILNAEFMDVSFVPGVYGPPALSETVKELPFENNCISNKTTSREPEARGDRVTTFHVLTDQELQQKALEFLKESKPQTYRQAQRDGDLQELVRLKATAAREYAESLIRSGEPPEIAWNRAIRLEILETESD